MASLDEKLDRLVMDEIGGKNRAVHAYDSIIWKIRTGFLTLLFAAWGIVLSSLIQSAQPVDVSNLILMFALWLVSFGLSMAGFAIDRNYVQRKFRVIRDLNGLLEAVLNLEPNDYAASLERVKPYLRVSGDSGDECYSEVGGYAGAVAIAWNVYCVPIGFVFLGIAGFAIWILLGFQSAG